MQHFGFSRRAFLPAVLLAMLPAGAWAGADEPIFSGPQPGEKLAPFKVAGVYDDAAGKELDFVTAAAGKPLLLIFVHDATRPSVGLTRALASYAKTRAEDGLACGVVWLAADRSEAEQFLKRARGSLSIAAPLGVSLDGAEGPGSYGLNRNVTLTILVSKDDKVTANFALVQPSMTEAPQIVGKVVELIGGEVPTLEQLAGQPGYARAEMDARFRELLRPVIQKDAAEADVKRAAAAVERYVGQAPARRQMLGRAARTIVDSGKLSNYGTPAAQEQLRAWAEKYGPPPRQ